MFELIVKTWDVEGRLVPGSGNSVRVFDTLTDLQECMNRILVASSQRRLRVVFDIALPSPSLVN